MMNTNFFVWNCRGPASLAFYRNCKQYDYKHKPVLIVIMETRISPLKLKKYVQLLGFDGYQFSEVNEYSGGIIVAWKEEVIRVDVLDIHFQFLHLMVTLQNGKIFCFTPIYASPQEEMRNDLWNKLHNISRTMIGEWLLAGDFNDIAHPIEEKGAMPAQQRKCDKFVDKINAC